MIQLRPVLKADEDFIDQLYGCTREAELNLTNWTEEQKTLFVKMQSAAQLAEYRAKFPGAAFAVILYQGKKAGRFYTWESDTEIRLMDITLLPAFRGKGIGSALLMELIGCSEKKGKKLSLHVEAANPALKLYLRLGFVRQDINGRHYYMERITGLRKQKCTG